MISGMKLKHRLAIVAAVTALVAVVSTVLAFPLPGVVGRAVVFAATIAAAIATTRFVWPRKKPAA